MKTKEIKDYIDNKYWKIRNELYFFIKIKIPQIRFIGKKGKENKEKKFLILYRQDPNVGIFSLATEFVKECYYAEIQGYIPVIDLQHFKNQISDNVKENAWDIFFKQPCNFSLEDVKNAKNKRYISRKEITKCSREIMINKDMWNKYVILNTRMKSYIDSFHIDCKNTMGIIARGTDVLLPIHGYNVIDIDSFVSICKEVFFKNEMKYVFIATEDSSYLEKFIDCFGDNLLFLNDSRTTIKHNNIFISDQWREEKIDMQLKTQNYICAIYILGKLDILIANTDCSSASVMKYIGDFSYIKICGKNICSPIDGDT